MTLTIGAMAQTGNNAGHKEQPQRKNVNFPASSVEYWVDTGSNSAVVVAAWDDNPNGDFALAWGVHWNGSTTALGLVDSIATHDSRFSYTFDNSSNLMTGVYYNDGTLVSGSSMYGWCYYLNSNWAMNTYNNQPVANGDAIEISSSCMFTMTTAVAASNPNPDPGPIDTTQVPVDSTIAAEDILFWVGEGQNEVVMAVNWADTALAWGYRFNTATVTALQMMNDIASVDPRFSYSGTTFITDINYIDTAAGMTDTLGITAGNYWWSLLNHVGGMGLGDVLHDGDFYKWGDLSVAVVTDSTDMGTYTEYTYVWPYAITPVTVPDTGSTPGPVEPKESTIAASEIVYWVGEGENEAVMAVNWTDTALAWGYRFDGSKTVSDMMDAIAGADPRFSFTMSGTYLGDILFVKDDGDTLRGTSWWESKHNGITDDGLAQNLEDGDFEKWADPAAGTIVDSTEYDGFWYYIYVYTMEIHPVSVPPTQNIADVVAVIDGLWPSPTRGNVNVRVNHAVEAVLYDIAGRRVTAYILQQGVNTLDLTSLAAGTYMLRTEGVVCKIVKR